MTDTTRHWTIYDSPIGPLTLVASAVGLSGLHFPGRLQVDEATPRRPMPAVAQQLDAYFDGELQAFEIGLDMRGTPLQREVWRRLCEIPYGTTVSYGQLAARVDPDLLSSTGEPWRHARAVGACNGANPVSIIVPCHRVIGADGSLTGYGGGLGRKRALLELERGVIGEPPPPAASEQRQISLL